MSNDDDDAAKLVAQFTQASPAAARVQLVTTAQAQYIPRRLGLASPGPEPEKPKEAKPAPEPLARAQPMSAVVPEERQELSALTGEAARKTILNRNAPYDTAKEFARRHCQINGADNVWFWQGQFWRWNGNYYVPDDENHTVMRGQVYKFLDGALRWGSGGGKLERFEPKPSHVNEVIDCLKTGLGLGAESQPPMWLHSREPATEWIAFANGAVNVLSGEVRARSPDLWVHSALGFDWNPSAACPVWEWFLQDIFPDDDESKQFIEEWMGYCMTEETRFQKGAMLIGPKRSGKGTISHVLRQLVGDRSYAGLSFNTWVSGENSRQPLIGKRVGVFADVRFKQGRAYGASFDPGGIGHVSTELLLNIIGEDTISIPRKYIGPWHGQLRLKLLLISNEIPNLNDTSGVLPSRFIKVHFSKSKYGQEDPNLRGKLSGELSGIATRCVAAYQHLCERGRFIQPQSAEALEFAVLAASDPFAAMALECFVPDYAGEVIKTVAYSRFVGWCERNGRPDLSRTTPENRFGEKLKVVSGFEHIEGARPRRPDGTNPRVWVGMRLKGAGG